MNGQITYLDCVQRVKDDSRQSVCKPSLDAKVQQSPDLLNTRQARAACGAVNFGIVPASANHWGGIIPPLLNRVASGNRVRRPTGEGMVREYGKRVPLNRPVAALIAKQSGCNVRLREKSSVGSSSHSTWTFKSEAKRPTGVPSNHSQIMSEGGLARSLPLSVLPVSQDRYMNRKEQYKAYLRSDDWKAKKEAKQLRSIKRCSICASIENVQLHHLYYRKTWQETQNQDLRWLCGLCHVTAHDLINKGTLQFPKPDNHHSCFALTKYHVKRALGYGAKNMFST